MQAVLKKIVFSVVALLSIFSVHAAEGVSFRTEAPIIAQIGEPFRVVFNLNAFPDNNTFVAPSFDGLTLLAGPSTSQGTSVEIVNNKRTTSEKYELTYILMPKKAGIVNIAPASIVVDGKRYTTEPTPIEVRAAINDWDQSPERRAANRVKRDDLLLRFELSSTSAYKGEPIRATLRLYSRIERIRCQFVEAPTFNGFWSQQNKTSDKPVRKVFNGKVYDVYDVADYQLTPQQEGTLVIKPIKIEAEAYVLLQIYRNNKDNHDLVPVQRELKTPEIKVQVKEFPKGAPSSFVGVVGDFKMSLEPSSLDMAVNSSATLRLTISGSGNMSFISAPKLSLPASFELYDVKSEDNIKSSALGSIGSRSFEYPFIARAEGDYELAPVEFTYFDLSKKKYVTLSTPPLKIKVTPDNKPATSVQQVALGAKPQNVQVIGKDIRSIKLDGSKLCSMVAPLVLSPIYWIAQIAMLLLALLVYVVIRKRRRDNQDIVLIKGRRANSVAVKRFRNAKKYMQNEDRRAFYEEMLRGLWGYLSDRFNIPVADLTRDVVRTELQRRGAMTEAETIIAVIARCEEAQYSPIATVEMKSIYEEGIEAVSKIEKVAK